MNKPPQSDVDRHADPTIEVVRHGEHEYRYRSVDAIKPRYNRYRANDSSTDDTDFDHPVYTPERWEAEEFRRALDDTNEKKRRLEAMRNARGGHPVFAARRLGIVPRYENEFDRPTRNMGGPMWASERQELVTVLLLDKTFEFVVNPWRLIHPILMLPMRDRPNHYLSIAHGRIERCGLTLLSSDLREPNIIRLAYKFNDLDPVEQEEIDAHTKNRDANTPEELRNMTSDSLRMILKYRWTDAPRTTGAQRHHHGQKTSSKTMFGPIQQSSFGDFVVVLETGEFRYDA